MNRSDVFDNFVKIAREKGLISEGEHAEHTEKNLDSPRWDSLDISAIEALYGVKPDAPKGMEYEHNIMEDAHPNSVVISPSYDKLNGLVENNIERQNILLHIIHKTPDGLSTQRKYAEQELLLSLVRIANDLDNKNQTQLMSLADICLEQASLTKRGQWIAGIAGIAAAVALVGAVYWKNHTSFNRDGFEQDYQKLVAEIDDLIQANDSLQTEVGAGYTYRPEFIQQMQDFKNKLEQYHSLYQSVIPYIDNLEKPKTGQELLEQLKDPSNQNGVSAYKAFVAASTNLLPYLNKIGVDFSSSDYKSRQIIEKGWAMKIVDPFLHGGKGFVADDFDDVAHALPPFIADMKGLASELKQAQNTEQAVSNEIKQTVTQSKQMFGGDTGTFSAAPFHPETKAPPTTTYVSNPQTVQDVDQNAQSLEEELKGLGLPV